jgi:hypothetical protein
MGVSWKVTQARLIKVKQNYPQISRKMSIGVKHKDQNKSAESRRHIAREIQQITLGKVKVKNNWMTNRMGAGDGVWQDHFNFKVDKTNFIQGCSMAVGKILRKMEILVDGTAVLCCEDATKKTNYGNVFELGIEKVWNNLLKEINLIYSKKYIEAKQNLICNDCSRAKYGWTNKDQSDQDVRQKQMSQHTGIPLETVTH